MKNNGPTTGTLFKDASAALVVLVVSLPLCLGIALGAGAPLFAGIVSGIVGGILVGLLSGSPTSVTGPGNSMMAIAATQIGLLGSFEAFLLAVVIAGAMQLVLGLARAGSLSAFIPSGVIKGLLAAIGIILVLKQLPHLVGHDTDPEGELYFFQPDQETTFSELLRLLEGIHPGAAAIGLSSIVVLVLWSRIERLKQSHVPAPLVVVLLGVGLVQLFARLGAPWAIGTDHLVQVPIASSARDFLGFLHFPDFTHWSNPAIYRAALTIAVVASLESLLSLEAATRIDPEKRTAPPSRELCAQGVGNMVIGLLGGIPVTSVIIRTTININAGARSKAATIIQGCLILISVAFLPTWINMIPLSCLAAILMVAGFRLASFSTFRAMWRQGTYQFLPFIVVVIAIIMTDLLVGVLVGLGVALSFILKSNLKYPLRRVIEKHPNGNVVRIELANQVSFLNRAVLNQVLGDLPRNGQVHIDAHNTDYIDPDVLELIREFARDVAPARGVTVSLTGFRRKYGLPDRIAYEHHATRALQEALTPAQVLTILQEGHQRFRNGERLQRDLHRQVNATAAAQSNLAIILCCSDARTPPEIIFDLGVGDASVVRIAGNIPSPAVLGSLEYACGVEHVKLILVMGHTRCSAVTAAITALTDGNPPAGLEGCPHVAPVLREIQTVVTPELLYNFEQASPRDDLVSEVALANVRRTMQKIADSELLAQLVQEGRLAIMGAMYDVVDGGLSLFPADAGSAELAGTRKES